MLVIATLFLGVSDIVGVPQHAPNDELQQYLIQTVEHHPALKARHAEWLAALETIPQAKTLDDPMFGYTHFVQSEEKKFAFMVEQMLPWFGTLKLRGDEAALEAEVVRYRMFTERDRLFASVKQAYFEYAYLADQLEILRAQAEILSYMQDVVTSKYSLGLSSEAELLRVQTERIDVRDRLDRLELIRPAASARLSQAMGLPKGTDLPWPQDFALAPELPDPDAVVAEVFAQNPMLHAYDAMAEAGAAAIELARKKGWPNISLGIEYMEMENMKREVPAPSLSAPSTMGNSSMGMGGTSSPSATASSYPPPRTMTQREKVDDDLSITVKVSLPIWRRAVRAGVSEAAYRRDAVLQEKAQEMLTLESEVRLILYEMEDARRRLHVYGDALVPQAARTFESLQNSYAADAGASFLDVFESVRELLDFNLEQAAAVRDLQTAAARLEVLLGRSLEYNDPIEKNMPLAVPIESIEAGDAEASLDSTE